MTPSRHLRMALVFLAALLVALSLLGEDADAGGKKKKNKKTDDDPPVAGAVDPRGKPAVFHKGQDAMFAVWFEKGAWHLRATTAKGRRDAFTGTVALDRGVFVGKVGGDLDKKAGAGTDYIRMNPTSTAFQFLFTNIGGTDTIAFKASPEATEMRFDLRIDGQALPQRVLVGKKGVHPNTNPFSLPAHP